METKQPKSPLFIIFTTVLVDLIGFGMVIPLIGLYGRHYGASRVQLAFLGGIYSLMQFLFSPFWGSLSDRIGRRPILLISLAGSTLSYLVFGLAPNYYWLLLARAMGGVFAANISTAQAFIADVTPLKDRAKGMGLIGAAFGIGFTLGPPLGGISSAHLGLGSPGLIAACICGLNFLLAIVRLPETLPPEKRTSRKRFNLFSALKSSRSELVPFLMTFFLYTFAFSMMEQTFSLLFQNKFNYETGVAGYKTGIVLMFSGVIGAIVQGGLIRNLVPKYGEKALLYVGLFLNATSTLLFPFMPTYESYFFLMIPLALGSGLIMPTLSSLISKSVGEQEQGATLGLSQGLGSLARAAGPFIGLLAFGFQPFLPYLMASFIVISSVLLLIAAHQKFLKKTDDLRLEELTHG